MRYTSELCNDHLFKSGEVYRFYRNKHFAFVESDEYNEPTKKSIKTIAELTDVDSKSVLHVLAEYGNQFWGKDFKMPNNYHNEKISSWEALLEAIPYDLIHQKDNSGRTPFLIAVSNKKSQIARSLMKTRKYNFNLSDEWEASKGNFPIENVIVEENSFGGKRYDFDTLKLLIERGLNICQEDRNGKALIEKLFERWYRPTEDFSEATDNRLTKDRDFSSLCLTF